MTERMDILNREHFVDNVMKIVNQLSDNHKGCCFAIEGSWGIGKTFVLEEIEKRIENTEDGFFLFHYNCWQYDYYDEPAVAIVSAMISSIQEDKTIINEDLENSVKAGYEFAGKKMKEIAGIFIKNKIGVDLISWADEIRGIKEDNKSAVHQFDKLFNFSQAIEKARKNLQEIAEKRTIVFVVDELDRCIPQYAIKVLERLHHIFYSLENVIVIMAIDRKQLEHSVEEMFGINGCGDGIIDVEKYLKKFIDFSMELDYGKVNSSFRGKYKFYFDKFSAAEAGDLGQLEELFTPLLNTLDIRTQEKMVEKVYMLHSIVSNETMDISVLGFEMLFEILELWDFGDKKNLALINSAHFINLEQKLGKYKIQLLKSMEKNSWDKIIENSNRKLLKSNVIGKIFWYFVSVFNMDDMEEVESLPIYLHRDQSVEVSKCILAARKFCEIHEYIK